jgi:outer membrane immunogenic protein
MKKYLVTAVALAGLWTGTAAAADMGVPRSYAPAPPTPWDGFYVGAVGGWGTGRVTSSDLNGFSSVTEKGWTFGGTIGYNWHINSVVFGVEGDYSAAQLQSQNGCVGGAFFFTACVVRMNWDSTIRARLGVPFGPIMPYVTGGAMVTGHRFGLDGLFTENGFAAWSAVVGGGVEWWIAPHWSAKVEDIYSVSTASSLDPSGFFHLNEKNVNLVRFGLNYQFGAAEAPAPLIHK